VVQRAAQDRPQRCIALTTHFTRAGPGTTTTKGSRRQESEMSQVQTHTRQQQAAPQQQSVTPRMNRLAVWALVLAVLTLGGVGSILGIVLGARARRQVEQSGERGSGVALSAIIVGVVTTLVAIAYWIVIAKHFGGGSSGSGTGGGGGGGGY
jgi:uncharacterized membrane protein YgcG